MSNKYLGSTSGLTVLSENETTPSEGMVAYVTSSFNSGHMNGDIKLAALSDTDATDVTGTELVTNGTFDTDTSGWTFEATATDNSVAGYIEAVTGGATNRGFYTPITLVSGKTYTVSYDVLAVSSAFAVAIGTTNFGSETSISDYVIGTGSYSHTFTATASSSYLNFRTGSASETLRLDNVSVRLAESDRSVNGNGLQVFGTVTKTAVATGADLVAYSGFSGSNYLQQPYNADLEVGTNDIVFMGWVQKGTSTSQQTILQRDKTGDNVGVGSFEINIQPTSGYVACHTYDGALQTVTSSVAVPQTGWAYVVAGIQNGLVTLYVDGALQGTTTATALSTGQEDVVIFGVRSNLASAPASTASFALWRISTTFPTAEQIKKIYEDEKVLFQDGAQATLYGTSDAVTALAYDDDTELLHVGTSAGRSVFSGLRRVDNTTDAVGSAISASNGLVAED